MERAGIRQSFTTRNVMQRPDWMSLQLVDGPFRTLEGLWTFSAIGTAGTRIVLEMRFEFANPVASMLFGRAFEQSVGELIDAFVARARQVSWLEPAGSGGQAPATVEVVYALPDEQRVVSVVLPPGGLTRGGGRAGVRAGRDVSGDRRPAPGAGDIRSRLRRRATATRGRPGRDLPSAAQRPALEASGTRGRYPAQGLETRRPCRRAATRYLTGQLPLPPGGARPAAAA